MSTLKIWDLHMTYLGPIDDEFLAGTRQLAESIANEPGVIWKIWTVEEGTNRFGSAYLFRNREYLDAYKAMHMKRLADFGIVVVSEHVFDLMETECTVTRAPLGG